MISGTSTTVGTIINRTIVLILLTALYGLEADTAWAQTDVNTGDILAGIFVSALAVDPQNTSVVYAGTNQGIFKSTDGGNTWSGPNFNSPKGPWITALSIDPQNSKTIYATSYNDYNDGIFKSTDGGISWTRMANFVGAWSLVIDPQNTSSIYVGAGFGDIGATPGIFRSSDEGASWVATSNFTIYALAIDPQNPATVYAGAWGVLKSTDRGQSWIPSDQSNATLLPRLGSWAFGYIDSLAIDPSNPSTIYAGTYRTGVVKSTDAGANWASITSGMEPMSVSKLVIDPVNTGIVYASLENGGLLKTTDGGRAWSVNSKLKTVHIGSLAIDPQHSRTIFIGTESGVWKSPDGGESWSANSEFPVLTLGHQSPISCTGSSWYLRVSNAAPDTSIQLLGNSNGNSWTVPDWRTTDSDGTLTERGDFSRDVIGTHSLHVVVGGVPSNSVSFVVSNCSPEG